MSGWQEMLRAGVHRDSAGVERTITPELLARIAANYDRTYHEAPVVLGHPKDDAPAYGWVEGLKAEGGKLFARFGQVHEGLRQAAERGHFRHRSIALYGDLDGRGPYLRHVGVLGAAPPAVKGMAPLKFTEGEHFDFEFEETEGTAVDEKNHEERREGLV